MAKSRVEKHEEALERQEYYNKLTLGQKIALAESRDGESKRELSRLRKLSQKEKKDA